jgi:hypothetical protein
MRASTALMLCLCLQLAGCGAVAPWERGTLAKPQMALEPHVGQRAQREHQYASREAATASGTAAGGGCGCY